MANRISRRKYYRENLRTLVSLSKAFRGRLYDSFKSYGLRASQEYKRDLTVADSFYDDFFDKLYVLFSRHSETVIDRVYKNMKRDLDIKAEEIIFEDDGVFVPVTPIVKAYINANTAQNVTRVTATTKKNIQRVIKKSIEEGLSEVDTGFAIRQSSTFSETRAKMIARTETHQAMNYGQYETAKGLLLESPQKEWISSQDARARSWHKAVSGTTVPIDNDFIIFTPKAGGGISEVPMSYCGDPRGGALNVINCRCSVIYHDIKTIVED
jgi:uncharacterized protein with gpF-like domain